MGKLKSFSIFFSFISVLIFLQCCGNENLVTTPSNNKINSLKKESTLPIVSINHSEDTVITLSKSGKTFIFNKNIPVDKLAKIDEYLTKHNISLLTQKVQPNLPPCNFHVEQYWELEDQYEPVTGKYLGVWTDKVDWTKCHDQYGFTYIVTSFSGVANAEAAHFPQSNIMINLPYAITQNDINSNPSFNYYYMDEPYDQLAMSSESFQTIASWISIKNSNALFLFSDFYWPDWDILCYPHYGNVNTLKTYWLVNSNIRIMCDQYDGNPCGDVHAFWDEYKADYGIPSRNLTNFITMEPGHASFWGDLLNVAMAWSYSGAMNPIWIWAGSSNVTESTMINFCSTAWQTHWLYRLKKYVTVYWGCAGNCTNCNWPNGNWEITNISYSNSQWVGY